MRGYPSSGSMLKTHLATFSLKGEKENGLALISFVTLTKEVQLRRLQAGSEAFAGMTKEGTRAHLIRELPLDQRRPLE